MLKHTVINILLVVSVIHVFFEDDLMSLYAF